MDHVLTNILLDQYAVRYHSSNIGNLLLVNAAINTIKNEYVVIIIRITFISFMTMENNYETVNKVLSISMFSWDCNAHMIHVENERAWDSYVKV